MSERRIRQADLDALKSELKLEIYQELDRKLWLLAKIFAVPLIGATVEILKMLKTAAEHLK